MASPVVLESSIALDNSHSTINVSLSIALAVGDVVVVGADTNNGVAVSGVTSPGLTFAHIGSGFSLSVWAAQATVGLSAPTVTISYAGTYNTTSAIAVHVGGAILGTPLDPNVTLPSIETGVPAPPDAVYSTDNSDDLILFWIGCDVGFAGTQPWGDPAIFGNTVGPGVWNWINGLNNTGLLAPIALCVYSQTVTVPQSTVSVGTSATMNGAAYLVMALSGATGPAPGATSGRATLTSTGTGAFLEVSPVGPFAFAFGPIPLFPDLPYGFPVRLSLVTDTIIGTTKSLREVRVAQQPYPLWDIELVFEELRDETQNIVPYAPFHSPTAFQQFEELCQLWLMMYGQTNVFAFDAPWDDSRKDQFIGTGDGTTTAFTLYRSWGTGATATLLPISLVNTIIEVKVANVVVPPAHYTTTRNQLVFQDVLENTYPPANGDDITVTFTFFYLCRFVADEQDFEEFAKNRWTMPSLKFRAVYWP